MKMKNVKKFFTLSRRADGFTLVELIVVIAILAILGGVAVPAYNGYTQKAKRAGDEQLLAAINKAYAAACLQNGYDMADASEHGGANMPLTAEKVVNLEKVGPVALQDEFAMFYAGNESSKFQVFAAIVYSPSEGRFCDVDSAPDMLVNGYLVDGPSLQAFKNSSLGKVGAAGLLEMMTDMSNELGVGIGSAALGAALDSPSYKAAVERLLELPEGMTYDEYMEAKEAAATDQYLKSKYPDYPNDENGEKLPPSVRRELEAEAEAEAAKQRAATEKNMLILVGASGAKDVDNDEFLALMKSGNAYDTINGNVKGNETSAEGTAQSALAYSLYASYCADKGIEVDPLAFTSALKGNDPDFNEYLKSDQAKTDLEGAQGALSIVGDQDVETLENTAASGLDNQELTDAMTQILG